MLVDIESTGRYNDCVEGLTKIGVRAHITDDIQFSISNLDSVLEVLDYWSKGYAISIPEFEGLIAEFEGSTCSICGNYRSVVSLNGGCMSDKYKICPKCCSLLKRKLLAVKNNFLVKDEGLFIKERSFRDQNLEGRINNQSDYIIYAGEYGNNYIIFELKKLNSFLQVLNSDGEELSPAVGTSCSACGSSLKNSCYKFQFNDQFIYIHENCKSSIIKKLDKFIEENKRIVISIKL